MECPTCKSENQRKNGKVDGGKQRYLCKDCGRNYTEHAARGYSLALRLQALKLFKEGMPLRGIGRILGVSNVSVLNWIRRFGEDLEEWYDKQRWAEYDKDIPVVEIDDIWHFCKKNNSKCGFGLLFAVTPEDSLPLRWAIVPLEP